jgi:hypothetical protein
MLGTTPRSTAGTTPFTCQMFCVFLGISHVSASGFSVMMEDHATSLLMKSSAKILRK